MEGRELIIRNEIAVLKRISSGHLNIVTLHDYFEVGLLKMCTYASTCAQLIAYFPGGSTRKRNHTDFSVISAELTRASPQHRCGAPPHDLWSHHVHSQLWHRSS